MKCLSCNGCSVQNKLIEDKKKIYRCQTKQSETSQQNEKEKMKSSSGVSKQFFKENREDTNICADETSGTIRAIPSGSTSEILKLHDFSGSKPNERCSGFHCDKFNTVFVDVGNVLVSDYFFEEDEDICKVSSEILLADQKDIDYHLVKSVKIEQDVEGSSSESDINDQNLDASVFNINAICTSNDRPGLATNQIHSKIKEEMDNYKEVSVINESIISIELNPVIKVEGLQDIGENNTPILDKSCSDELPDKSVESETKNIFIVQKPLKAAEAVQREMKTILQRQNEVQTLNGTLQSDLQIKLETNSRDYDATVGEEEYVNKLCVADENKQLNSKNDVNCQNRSNENSELNVDRPFGCTICGKAFTQLTSLTHHKRIHTGENPFGCTICGKAFREQSHLTGHNCIHTGEKPYGCTICEKLFRNKFNLTSHKCVHTEREKPIECNICGKAFTEQGLYTNHRRIHTEEKPFGCTICGKAFREQSNLIRHKCIHTGEKPYDCTICGKSFSQKHNLTSHKRIHTGEKPFVCIICGKTFRQQAHLTSHIRIHTGEKPFCCTVCGKIFTQLNSLTDHKRLHTGEKPFVCTVCGKAFRHRNTHRLHKREHTTSYLVIPYLV